MALPFKRAAAGDDAPASSRTLLVFGTLVMNPTKHAENLLIHSGSQNPYSSSHPFGAHTGAGGLIQLEDVENASDSTAADFAVRIKVPQLQDRQLNDYAQDLFSQLQREVLKHNLQDKLLILDVAFWEGDLAQASLPPPRPLWAGFVDSVSITQQSIDVLCYTAAHRLEETTYASPVLTDFQQRNWKDGRDDFCKYATSELSDSGIKFP